MPNPPPNTALNFIIQATFKVLSKGLSVFRRIDADAQIINKGV